jgi:sulfatase maturation enzyme AslB (radical SAM superfamily)
MYKINEVQHVHLEISSLCNASCPWCPRNFWGYPFNSGYPELNFTLENAQHIFTPLFLKQLTGITINGNFGDAVMNPETPLIVEYFRSNNKNLNIEINTNGGARDSEFWGRLAKARAHVLFALDGLADTHHLYRQNTSYDVVVKNAQAFIKAGGQATWKMIEFDHNRHQIQTCKEISESMGFRNFSVINHGRNIAPVFNKTGILTHTIGNYTGDREFSVLFHKKVNDEILLEDITGSRTPMPIKCKVKQTRSMYIAANGDISPCCFTGFYPHTYGNGQYHQAANAQLKPIMKKNNALQYKLEECLEWFTELEKTWDINRFENGRLVICNDVCGTVEKIK